MRHPLNRRDLARAKIYAMQTEFQERELPTEVDGHYINVVTYADEFRDIVKANPPDLIICATDSRQSRRFVNHCALHFGIPLVIAGFLAEGRIGEVLLFEPVRTACYECVRLELGASLEAPASDERPDTPYVGGEALDLQSAVQRMDVGFVASLATRAALSILDNTTYEALPAKLYGLGTRTYGILDAI